MRFINHSKKPNSSLIFIQGIDGVAHVAVVAIEHVDVGSEILLDYGPEYWARSTIDQVTL